MRGVSANRYRMNPEAQQIIHAELDPGESILWAGKPKQGTVFRGSDFFMIPFSLLWGGFAIVWEIMAVAMIHKAEKVPDGFVYLFPLFGIPFVAIGLYMIFGRFIYDSKRRSKTFYGVTNERAIIVSGLFRKNVKSLSLKAISDLSIDEKSNNRGTILFGQESPMMSVFMGGGFPGTGSTTPRFELIENAKQVYNQIRSQQKR